MNATSLLVSVPAAGVELEGELVVPADPVGIALFAHGSGSSRHSPRNRLVAVRLHGSAIGTLLFDLLTRHEELDRANVFDVELLGRRLHAVASWLRGQPEAEGLPVGYFGASTGAAAALWSAAQPDAQIAAVVSRGGRPDLAALLLPDVTAPTLLVVGGMDSAVLELNRQAARLLGGEHAVAVVPGATHLFEEKGALDEVARLASAWFGTHFVAAGAG